MEHQSKKELEREIEYKILEYAITPTVIKVSKRKYIEILREFPAPDNNHVIEYWGIPLEVDDNQSDDYILAWKEETP